MFNDLFLLFNNLFYFIIVIAFIVKIPIFLVHLWLPKAHVEAPISGSIILAGVLLKLGGYGLLRVLIFLFFFNFSFSYYWIRISLLGGVLISLNCLRQVDFKSLIAYSSVAHIGIVLAGLITIFYWGLNSSYTIIIAHGLCSSGLFCLANLAYERLSSRSLLINKGLLRLIPRLTLWWFFLCSRNMSAPPTLNLLGEIGLLNSIIAWTSIRFFLLVLLSFFSAAYCFYLYSYTQHGLIFSLIYSYSRSFNREYLLLFLHWVPLNLLIIKRRLVIIWLYLNSLLKY
jgi:NADH-ubiquinone oxidoreductase chain 4